MDSLRLATFPESLRRGSFWAALFIAGQALLAFGAAASSSGRNIRFDHLSLEQGLSQGAVNCIVQDQRGFMWIGTQDGLNRYDGYTFTVFKHDPADEASLSANTIWSLWLQLAP